MPLYLHRVLLNPADWQTLPLLSLVNVPPTVIIGLITRDAYKELRTQLYQRAIYTDRIPELQGTAEAWRIFNTNKELPVVEVWKREDQLNFVARTFSDRESHSHWAPDYISDLSDKEMGKGSASTLRSPDYVEWTNDSPLMPDMPKAGVGGVKMAEYDGYPLYNVLIVVTKTNLPPAHVNLSDNVAGQLLALMAAGEISKKSLHDKWPSTFDGNGLIYTVRKPLGWPAIGAFKNDKGKNELGYWRLGECYTLCGYEAYEHYFDADDNKTPHLTADAKGKYSYNKMVDDKDLLQKSPMELMPGAERLTEKTATMVDAHRLNGIVIEKLSDELRAVIAKKKTAPKADGAVKEEKSSNVKQPVSANVSSPALSALSLAKEERKRMKRQNRLKGGSSSDSDGLSDNLQTAANAVQAAKGQKAVVKDDLSDIIENPQTPREEQLVARIKALQAEQDRKTTEGTQVIRNMIAESKREDEFHIDTTAATVESLAKIGSTVGGVARFHKGILNSRLTHSANVRKDLINTVTDDPTVRAELMDLSNETKRSNDFISLAPKKIRKIWKEIEAETTDEFPIRKPPQPLEESESEG